MIKEVEGVNGERILGGNWGRNLRARDISVKSRVKKLCPGTWMGWEDFE